MDKQQVAEFQILQEIENNNTITQRDLAKRTGISLSYLNSYLKRLVSRELILVKKMDGKRLFYNLTPKGAVEKVRMTTAYAKWSLNHYMHIRQKVVKLCSRLKQEGMHCITICGLSEAAEIVFVAALECGLEIIKVIDERRSPKTWLQREVEPLEAVMRSDKNSDFYIIADIDRCYSLAEKLNLLGVPYERMTVYNGQKYKPVSVVQLVD